MSLQRFNFLYAELVGQLRGIVRGGLKVDYSQYGEEDFIKDFVRLNLPYIDDVASRNPEIFQTRLKRAELVAGLKMGKLLAKVPKETGDAIFDYLRDLYLEGAPLFEHYIGRVPADNLIAERSVAVEHREALEALFKGGDVPVAEVEVEESSDDEDDDGALPFDPQALFEQINGSEIGKVAREICEGMGEEEQAQMEGMVGEGMQNPGDLFSKLFSEMSGGGGSEGLGGIVKKTMDTVQQKIESGEIDMEKMMADAQKFVGSLGGAGFPPGMFPPGAGAPKKKRGGRGKGKK